MIPTELEGVVIHVHHGTAYAYRANEDGTFDRLKAEDHSYMAADKLPKFRRIESVSIDPLDRTQNDYLEAIRTLDEIAGTMERKGQIR